MNLFLFIANSGLSEPQALLSMHPLVFLLGALVPASMLFGLTLFGRLFGSGGKVEPKSRVESLREQKQLIEEMCMAAYLLNVRKVRKILEQGIDVNARDKNGDTPLMASTRDIPRGDPAKMVAFLAENGAELDIRFSGRGGNIDRGKTPLMISAGHGFLKTVEILLEHGADVNARNTEDYGETTLMYAAHGNNGGVVTTLLEKGAEINAHISGGETALFFATKYSLCLEAATVLLERGADIDAQDEQGNTALMKAVGRGNEELIEFLLKHEADVALRNNEGNTAFGIAKEKERDEIVMALLEEAAEKAGHDVEKLAANEPAEVDS